MTDAISKVQIDYVSTGADQAAADYDRVAQAERRLGQSSESVARVTDTVTRSTLSAQKALDGYTRAHDPLSRAMADLARGERLVTAARAQGIEVTAAHTRGLDVARTRVAELTHELEGHSAAVGFNRMQVMEATHVAKSFADEIAAGQSPLRALQVEGGRIAQIFSEGQGGVGGTLKSAGALVGRLATGWVGLTVATAAVVGVTAAAGLAYENSQERMARALEGTGRRAGLTVAQLDAVASAGVRAGNLGVGEARNLAGAYAGAGLGADTTATLLGSTARYARFTGQDDADAGKALAAAFADPTKGADELDKSLGFLNDKLAVTIKDYEASGQHAAAQRVLLDAYSAALKGTTDSTWALGDAFREVKRWSGSLAGGLGEGVNHILGGDRSLEDQLSSYKAMLPHTFDSPLAVGNLSQSYVQGQIDRLQHELDARVDPGAAKRDADANALSNQAGPIIRSILPDLVRAESASNNLALIRQAFSDPAVLDRLSISPDRVRQAAGDLAVTSANADPGRRGAQDYALQEASIDAFSVAERAAVDARRAELAVLRETGDVARAAEAAERARNLVIEKANSDAKDRLEIARQDAALVGLSPYQRGRQEIVNQYEGYGGQLAKDAASRSDLSDAMKPVADDLKRALGEVAAAIRTAAADIRPSPYGTLQPFVSNATGASLAGGFSATVNRTLGFEGGYRPADTNGTATNFGINQAAYPNLDVASLTKSDATSIYKRDYWDKIGADSMTPAMARVAFDTAVMEGVSQALKIAGQSGGDAGKMLDLRQGYEGSLEAKDPAKYGPYAKAWALRDANLRADISTGPAAGAGSGGAVGPVPSAVTITAARSSIPAPVASTAAGDDTSAEAVKLAAYDRAQQLGPITAATTALSAQNAMLKVQIDTYGQAADKIAAAAEKQKLVDEYMRQGIPITGDLAGKIDALAAGYGASAKAAADWQRQTQALVGAMDELRSTSKDALGTFVGDLRQGKSAGDALRDTLLNVENKMISMAENSAIDALFGKSGTSGGGVLGGGISSLLSGLIGHNAEGTGDWRGGPTWVGERGPEIVNLPPHATVATNTAAMAMMGASSKAASPAPQTFNFNVTTPSPQAFAASQGQMAAVLSRAAASGARNS